MAVSRCHSRGADGDRDVFHQWIYRLVVQEICIGILRLSRIEESKICRPFRCRVIDDRKKAPWQFCVGGCSLFVETGVWPNSSRTIQVLLPIPVGGPKPILPVSSGGVLAFFAFAAEPRPGHRFQTSLRDRLLAYLAHSECTQLDPSECLLDRS